MYIPKYFRLDNPEEALELIAQQPLGILVDHDGTQSVASHIPFVASREDGEITLRGHVARGNSLWRIFERSPQALVIFQGPHTYISSSWYADTNVPTWNYLAVHLYGEASVMTDDEFHDAMKVLLDQYEGQRDAGRPWDTLPEDFRERQMAGIVGLKIRVTSLEAAAKMSQNRNTADYQNIVSELERSQTPEDQNVGKVMKHLRPEAFGDS